MDIIEGIDGFTEDGGEGRTTFGFAFPNADGPGTPACVASLFVPPDPPMLDFKCLDLYSHSNIIFKKV